MKNEAGRPLSGPGRPLYKRQDYTLITVFLLFPSRTQDPEVVMAPLPVSSHRPLSMDSRETSMSSGSRGNTSGGNVSTGAVGQNGKDGKDAKDGKDGKDPASADSVSGYSLPLRSQKTNNSSAPDSPSTLDGTLGNSSDYLVPTTATTSVASMQPRNGAASMRQRSLDDAAEGDALLAAGGELETSFSYAPRRMRGSNRPAAANRSYGYVPPNPPRSLELSGSSSTQALLASPATADGCPTGPLPPTPPSPAALDASSLAAAAAAPPQQPRPPGTSASGSSPNGHPGPYTIEGSTAAAAASAASPAAEISV